MVRKISPRQRVSIFQTEPTTYEQPQPTNYMLYLYKPLTFRLGLIILLLFTAHLLTAQAVDCAQVATWDTNTIYATAGTPVKYNGNKYSNRWWTQGDNPEQSGEWGVWELQGVCNGDDGGDDGGGDPTDSTALQLGNLPLQINQNQGTSVTYTFSGAITSVLSRNRGVASFQVNNDQVTINGLKAGRTGLKIMSGGQAYYMGLRVNHTDGSLPGLPQYLSVGSVSEDKAADLGFWEDIDTDLTNKEMDIRYIYINGGAIGGWRSWGPDRPRKFAEHSMRLGLIPFFVYYNIPDNGESYELDLAHVRDVNYMTEYFIDINTFMDEVQNVMQGELYGVILEPDFLGYMQQQSGTQDPTEISTAVSATNIAPGAGNIRTLVERINATIDARRDQGHNIFYGWQLNLWAYPLAGTGQGVLRSTDTEGFDAGRAMIKEAGTQTTLFAISAGVLTHDANFLSIDKYGLDAMGHVNDADPSKSRWFFNNDHWKNYLYFVENMHTTSGYPIILWQLPVGHINSTSDVSAYTGQGFPDLNNTDTRYEDSSSDFFLGDTFNPGTSIRRNYFAENKYGDSKVSSNGSQITWGSHMQETKDAGVISVLFGAGVNSSTDGVGSPPTDDSFWIQKVQEYYAAGAPVLDKEYGSGDSPCASGCAPVVRFLSHADGDEIIKSTITPVDIQLASWDLDGSVNSLTVNINGQTYQPQSSGSNYSFSWTPPGFGSYSIATSAVDNAGISTTKTIQVTVKEFNPADCSAPVWDANTIYSTKGTEVAYDGNIYKNKWWTQGDNPSAGGVWEFVRACSGSGSGVTVTSAPAVDSPTAYPNPFDDRINFRFTLKSEEHIAVTLYNAQGQIAGQVIETTLPAGGHALSFPAERLNPGLYFLVMTSNGKVLHQAKLIK
ncbi:T9SS type A sorting domain-containing protein [Fulvivirga sp. 29W222]|uniref:T9SS type A sorting domain-containing protein n=1 Tax=Fulvivirga marina TaxID=2494733 RepID=A0A937FX60_9BACT|nr:carbohydrate-binding protein [Fulvivirga marina]MBL6446352.1 T9SS type A sorting domain-containing protein [Fulvivirga marina]